jgi:hypothetical protein
VSVSEASLMLRLDALMRYSNYPDVVDVFK